MFWLCVVLAANVALGTQSEFDIVFMSQNTCINSDKIEILASNWAPPDGTTASNVNLHVMVSGDVESKVAVAMDPDADLNKDGVKTLVYHDVPANWAGKSLTYILSYDWNGKNYERLFELEPSDEVPLQRNAYDYGGDAVDLHEHNAPTHFDAGKKKAFKYGKIFRNDWKKSITSDSRSKATESSLESEEIRSQLTSIRHKESTPQQSIEKEHSPSLSSEPDAIHNIYHEKKSTIQEIHHYSCSNVQEKYDTSISSECEKISNSRKISRSCKKQTPKPKKTPKRKLKSVTSISLACKANATIAFVMLAISLLVGF